tara:strand:- start:83 stop:652 length:570 start_codon:yes stop_codon:yes gene_type:complete
MADLFESEQVNSEEVKVIENEVEHEMGKGIAQPDEPIKKKVKKPRKPLSDERKAQLREQLKKGRETSLAKRQQGKKKKELVSVKQEDLKEYKAEAPRVSNYQKEVELEDRLAARISKRIKKQQEDERKDAELIKLRQQLAEMKKPIGIVPIKEEKPKPIEKPAEPVRPARPVYNKFSPHQNHFMGGNFF